MSGETPPDAATPSGGSGRFEDIDWEALESGSPRFSRSGLATAGAVAVVGLVFAYDLIAVPQGQTLVFDWNPTELDWLFGLTLLFMARYIAYPLYRNPRMTAHYWRQFRRNRAAVWSLGYLLVVFVLGTGVPLIVPPPELNVVAGYQPPMGFTVDDSVPVSCLGDVVDGRCTPTWRHPLGTTADGKDIMLLVVFGMRVSMQVGLIATLLIIVIGTAVGTVAAYYGGMVDEALMRYVDIQLTFPTFFLYLLLVYLFGGSLFLLIVIFGVTSWGGIARLVRSEALQRREEEYIRAAQGAGGSEFYIIRRHIVPNVSNTIITAATLTIPGLILAEAALSFIQLGDPTIPSWGQVIAAGRGDLGDAWWISTVPGVFLFFTILAFNFLGDALRDALDPRLEH